MLEDDPKERDESGLEPPEQPGEAARAEEPSEAPDFSFSSGPDEEGEDPWAHLDRSRFAEDDPFDEDFPPPSPESFVRMALVFYGVMGCGALAWRMWTPGQSIMHPLALEPERLHWLTATAWGTALGLVSLALSEVLTRTTKVGEALSDALGEGLAGIGRADAILLALASGTAEEMFFRGALQPAVGLLWASVLFGACHFLPRRDLAIWSVYAVAMGLALGWLFEWTGQLMAPIAAHVVVNAVNLPRLARRAAEKAEEEEAGD